MQPQFLLGTLELGDVGQGDPAAFLALGILEKEDVQEHDPQVAVAVLEVDLAPPLPVVQAVVQQLAQNLAVGVHQEIGEEAVQEFAALHAQEGGGGEVGLDDPVQPRPG